MLVQVAAVSTVVNHSILLPYVFSNYTHPYGSISKFPQSCKYRLWEALRASTAAPGFFEEFKLGHEIHQVFYENVALLRSRWYVPLFVIFFNKVALKPQQICSANWRKANNFFTDFPIFELGGIAKKSRTGPTRSIEIYLPSTSMFPGKQKSLYPLEPVINCLWITHLVTLSFIEDVIFLTGWWPAYK